MDHVWVLMDGETLHVQPELITYILELLLEAGGRLQCAHVALCKFLSVSCLQLSNHFDPDFASFRQTMAPKQRLLEPWQLQELAATAEKGESRRHPNVDWPRWPSCGVQVA